VFAESLALLWLVRSLHGSLPSIWPWCSAPPCGPPDQEGCLAWAARWADPGREVSSQGALGVNSGVGDGAVAPLPLPRTRTSGLHLALPVLSGGCLWGV
jgi:hypothetical protein